jgi:hypothetical protein
MLVDVALVIDLTLQYDDVLDPAKVEWVGQARLDGLADPIGGTAPPPAEVVGADDGSDTAVLQRRSSVISRIG